MASPDERVLLQDLADGPFLLGAGKGLWGRHETEVVKWPDVIFWVSVAARPNGPPRFHLRLNCAGYPGESPTGTLWNPATGGDLAHAKWPKGKERVQAVFRTDWQNGKALYHPYDRVSMRESNHSATWPAQYPHLVWSPQHTIVDVLSVIHELLNSSEYTHV